MNLYSTILKDFYVSFNTLNEVGDRGCRIYEEIRLEVFNLKQRNVSLIGHPLMKLENQLITFNYLVGLQILNTKVYHDLLNEDITIDYLLIEQLQGLIDENNEYQMQLDHLASSMNNLRIQALNNDNCRLRV